MFVNYEGSILSHVASIRRYFGLEAAYESDPGLSDILQRQRPKKVFVLLVDGMGANLLERKLKKDAFLRRNMLCSVMSVFPPTTTAATTSIRNGLAPCQNGWLGWTQYLEEVDDIIIPFRSIGYYSDIRYEEDIFRKCVPVLTMEEELNDAGIPARILFPAFAQDGCQIFDEMCERLIGFSQESSFRYLYAYWDKYDALMHHYGPDSQICDSYLQYLNYQIEYLSSHLHPDTLLLVVADHGQVAINRFYNLCHSEFEKYFSMRPSLEQRAMAFYIREGMREDFALRFKECFEKDYILLSRKQVLDGKLFGDGKNHPRFEQFIGDFLAIGKSDLVLIFRERDNKYYRGQHAGICDDELYVPVIVSQNGACLFK